MGKRFTKMPISASSSGSDTAVYIDYRDASYDGSLYCTTYHGIDDASIIFQHKFDFTQAEADYQGPNCVRGVHPDIAEFIEYELGYGPNNSIENYRDYFNSEYQYNLDTSESCWYIYWV